MCSIIIVFSDDLGIYRGVTSMPVADNKYPHPLGTLHAIYRQFLANAWAYTFNNLLNLFKYVCIFVYMYICMFYCPFYALSLQNKCIYRKNRFSTLVLIKVVKFS